MASELLTFVYVYLHLVWFSFSQNQSPTVDRMQKRLHILSLVYFVCILCLSHSLIKCFRWQSIESSSFHYSLLCCSVLEMLHAKLGSDKYTSLNYWFDSARVWLGQGLKFHHLPHGKRKLNSVGHLVWLCPIRIEFICIYIYIYIYGSFSETVYHFCGMETKSENIPNYSSIYSK